MYLFNIELIFLAFKSLGICPLDLNWINKEENLKKIAPQENFSQVYTAEDKLKRATSSFLKEHIKELDYRGFVDAPSFYPSSLPFEEENRSVETPKFDVEEAIRSRELSFPTHVPRVPKKKRKRLLFEDQSESKILNDDNRLAKLEAHLLKKVKKNDDKQDLKELKVKVDLHSTSSKKKVKTPVKPSLFEEDFDSSKHLSSPDKHSKQRGFSSSLASEIQGLKNYNSTEDDETVNYTLHTLYLPLSTETDTLTCKKHLVSFFNIQIIISFRILD